MKGRDEVCLKACEGCAYKEGAAANLEPQNNVKAKLCALGGIPFYCHDNADWRSRETHRPATRSEIRERGISICAGWKAEVARLSRSGHFKESRLFKRCLAAAGLEAVAEFEVADEEGDVEYRAEVLGRLERIFRLFIRERELVRARNEQRGATL